MVGHFKRHSQVEFQRKYVRLYMRGCSFIQIRYHQILIYGSSFVFVLQQRIVVYFFSFCQLTVHPRLYSCNITQQCYFIYHACPFLLGAPIILKGTVHRVNYKTYILSAVKSVPFQPFFLGKELIFCSIS